MTRRSCVSVLWVVADSDVSDGCFGWANGESSYRSIGDDPARKTGKRIVAKGLDENVVEKGERVGLGPDGEGGYGGGSAGDGVDVASRRLVGDDDAGGEGEGAWERARFVFVGVVRCLGVVWASVCDEFFSGELTDEARAGFIRSIDAVEVLRRERTPENVRF
jgi:hypothetical protein